MAPEGHYGRTTRTGKRPRVRNDAADQTRLRIDVLLEEYRGLRVYVDQNMMLPYKIVPLGLGIAAAILTYHQSRGLASICASYGMVLLVCLFGFLNSCLNAAGLRLVELEKRLNTLVELSDKHGMRWYDDMILAGPRLFIGMNMYFILCIILGVLVLGGSLVFSWEWFRHELYWSVGWTLVVHVPPVLMSIGGLFGIRRIERKYVRMKSKLKEDLRSKHVVT